MSFVFLVIGVVFVLVYALVTGTSRSIYLPLVFLGVALNIIGFIFFVMFEGGDAIQYYLPEKFSFSARLAFISYGCLISGLLLSIINFIKK